ncbi:MAG: cytochrome c biogenesis protein CcsA [Betaproteobacteria bacterium]|nr:cytochrome c biogenesis protein CcsA [Betaproteobacteria bacterium]MBI3056692.1 cytochrome c biogenesis protein CcsA [Betaproteobacteria bacterium]
MANAVFYPITSLMYAALAVYFWRTRWVVAARPAGLRAESKMLEQLAVLVPLALHAMLLYDSMFAGDGVRLGVGNAMSTIVWLTVAIYWLGNLFYNIEGLQAMVMPVAAVCALLPVLLPPASTLPNTELVAFRVHLLISMLAYSLFTIASLHVLLMALLERRLHGGELPAALHQLPPLLTMETLLFRIITAGFILLTLTLATGIVFTEELFGKAMRFNHKTVFGILSWFIFAALLGGRQLYGWRGRIAVRWTLTGFLMLVLAYVGSKFVLEVILGRG